MKFILAHLLGTPLADLKPMSCFIRIVTLTLILLPFSALSIEPPPVTPLNPIIFAIGEQRILHTPSLLKFSISGPFRSHRMKHPDRILIKSLKPGTGTLIWTQENQKIFTHELKSKSPQIQVPDSVLFALQNLKETEVHFYGSLYLLHGRIQNRSEAFAIFQLRTLFPQWIQDETEATPEWLDQAEREIRNLLREHPQILVIRERGNLQVHGSVVDAIEAQNLRAKMRNILPIARIELTHLSEKNLSTTLKVYLMEMKKETLGSFGVSPPHSLQGSFQALSGSSLIWDPFPLRLDALQQRGALKILSAPELSVRIPGKADLFAGGEIPIQNRAQFQASTEWKNFGLTFRVETKELGGDVLRLTIETEMSHLQDPVTGTQLPSMKTNRMRTEVNAKMGVPLFLSGLFSNEEHRTQRGWPGLKDIPVFGALFGSEDFQNKASEFVAVLVPYLGSPPNPMRRIDSWIPSGKLPIPRNSESSLNLLEIRKSPDFPWNIL